MPSHPSGAAGWESRLGTAPSRVWLLGRYPIRVQPELVEPVKAMEQALRATGYEDPTDYIGSYSYRTISGLDVWSTHAYGIAIDLDYGGGTDPEPDRNPHLHRRIVTGDPGFGTEFQLLEHQVRAVENIRNTEGERIWRWLGWSIGDTMHFQANVPPTGTTVDWSTVQDDGVTMIFKDQRNDAAEPIKWMLYEALGGTIDPTANSGDQLVSVGLSRDARIMDQNDFEKLAEVLGLPSVPEKLWPYGKEVAALAQRVDDVLVEDVVARHDAAQALARADSAHIKLDRIKAVL